MFARIKILGLTGLLAFLHSSSALAVNSLQETLQPTTSVAGAYGSRSLFINPAALGFEKALNGSGFYSSYASAINFDRKSEHALGFSYANFGLGIEWLRTTQSQFNRYTLALGSAIGTKLYWGLRYQVTGSENASLSGFNSVDLGLQIRPSQFFSIGFMAQTLNQPTVNSVKIPAFYQIGLTFRPIKEIDLTLDLSSPNRPFASDLTYDVNAYVKVAKGVHFNVGYDQAQHWHFGLQLNFGVSSFYSVGRVQNGSEQWILGSQTSFRPYPTSFKFQDTLEVEINSALREEPLSGNLFASGSRSIYEVYEQLENAKKSSGIHTIAVRIESLPFGLAVAEELFQLLWELREQGKTVNAYIGSAGLKEYFVASAANRIIMEPTGELSLLGFKMSRYYLKGTLDKVGIEGEVFAKGKYKFMPEVFTRKGSSPLYKKESLRQLAAVEQVFLDYQRRTNRIPVNKWKKIVQNGLYGAQLAQAEGLVDAIGSFEADKDTFGYSSTKSLKRYRSELALPQRVAVIVASGGIVSRKSGLLSLGGDSQVYPEKMEAFVDSALADPLTKAIVLRVSSPGGEILPSQRVADLLDRAKGKKPIVVSMGDVAASGGYMISAPANTIFANQLTLTGSIGVFLGKPNLQKLFGKIDLNKEIISLSPYAGIYSEHRGLSAPEKAILLRRLDSYYSTFVTQVAEHRELPVEKVGQAAQGRVWLGNEALTQKLVDRRGTFMDATKHAATLGHLAPGNYDTVFLKNQAPLFSPMSAVRSAKITELLGDELSHSLLQQWHWSTQLTKSPFLYWTPHSLE